MQAATVTPTLCPTCLIVGIEELVTQTQSDHYFRDQGMGFRQHARYARKKLSYACVCIASTIQRYCAEEIFAHATLFCMERKPQRFGTRVVELPKSRSVYCPAAVCLDSPATILCRFIE